MPNSSADLSTSRQSSRSQEQLGLRENPTLQVRIAAPVLRSHPTPTDTPTAVACEYRPLVLGTLGQLTSLDPCAAAAANNDYVLYCKRPAEPFYREVECPIVSPGTKHRYIIQHQLTWRCISSAECYVCLSLRISVACDNPRGWLPHYTHRVSMPRNGNDLSMMSCWWSLDETVLAARSSSQRVTSGSCPHNWRILAWDTDGEDEHRLLRFCHSCRRWFKPHITVVPQSAHNESLRRLPPQRSIDR